jgi:hypothetical protein
MIRNNTAAEMRSDARGKTRICCEKSKAMVGKRLNPALVQLSVCFSENKSVLPYRAKHRPKVLKETSIGLNAALHFDSVHWMFQAAVIQTNSTAHLFTNILP